MFDWIRTAAAWLQQFIVETPVYVAAPAMVIIGALDSSLLSLPEINDYLVVMRCYTYPSAVFYFPFFAALGSVIGCTLLYSIMQRGGQAVLRRRFRAKDIERVERAYARYGFLTLAIPALLPPPMPFKIFVATAGALEYPRRRFMATIMLARGLRYYVEGTLAIYFGRYVLEFIEHYGLIILGVVASIVIVGLLAHFIRKRLRATQDASETNEAVAPAASGETVSPSRASE